MILFIVLGVIVLAALFAAGIRYVLVSGKKQRIMQQTIDKYDNHN